MQKALATFRKGNIELTSPVDWPEDTAVEVIPLQQQIGMTEDGWPTTADGIQSLLNRMEEATFGDDEPVEFAWDWPTWDAYQIEASRASWNAVEKVF
jgi:hypothetical protein